MPLASTIRLRAATLSVTMLALSGCGHDAAYDSAVTPLLDKEEALNRDLSDAIRLQRPSDSFAASFASLTAEFDRVRASLSDSQKQRESWAYTEKTFENMRAVGTDWKRATDTDVHSRDAFFIELSLESSGAMHNIEFARQALTKHR